MVLNIVAHQLREARLKRGWNVKEAAQESNVAERFLQELEDGGSELPLDIYRREFLRRYAQALGLPADDLWKTFKEEKRLTSRQHTFEFQDHRAPSRLLAPRRWRTFIGSFALTAILLYMAFSVTRVWALPDLMVQSPPDRLTVGSAELTVKGRVSADAIITVNGVTVVPSPSGTFESSVVLAKGLNTITVTAQRKRVSSATVVRQVYFESQQ